MPTSKDESRSTGSRSSTRASSSGRAAAGSTSRTRNNAGTTRRTRASGATSSRPRAGSANQRPGNRPSSSRAPRSSRRTYRTQTRVPLGRSKSRLTVIAVVMSALVLWFGGRAFQLQAYDAQAYAAAAAKQMDTKKTLIAQRGEITDRNGVVLASSQQAVKIIASPEMIARNGIAKGQTLTSAQAERAKQAPGMVAEILARHLGMDHGAIQKQITDNITSAQKGYLVLARQVPAYTYLQIQNELAAAFDKKGLYGISKEDDPVRVYPAGDVASNVVGFVNAEGQGAGGLEYSFNDELNGTNGVRNYQGSANGRIPLGKSAMVPAEDGNNYTLTIESELQMMVNQLLSKAVAQAGAQSGSVVVQNVKTGVLLVLTTTPSFSSSEVAKADAANLNNRTVSTPYEPGSVQKVVTFAALADQGLVRPDTRVVVPPLLPSGDGKIKDAFAHDTLNLTASGVMANSSNIGTVLLTRNLAKPQLVNYLKDFGLGAKTKLGLPGESAGSIPSANMPDYSRDQVSFGQGLSVTAVQEASAISAIANGGVYNSPTIIKSGTDGNGNPVSVPASNSRRVISPEASKMTLQMMESVITFHNKDRALTNYRWAGKTGTAQIWNNDTHRYQGYTASFVGVAPAEDPQLLVYVVIDRPTNGSEGSKLALPVAKQIMQLALPRYGILPSTTKAPAAELEYQP